RRRRQAHARRQRSVGLRLQGLAGGARDHRAIRARAGAQRAPGRASGSIRRHAARPANAGGSPLAASLERGGGVTTLGRDQEHAVKMGYDYVIVAAGSAGGVSANRLSEDEVARVLLIEAGGRDLNPLIHIPLGMGKMHERDMFNWGYHTEPEPNMNDRKIEAMRGK